METGRGGDYGFTSSDGSTSSALAILRMVFGYRLPPFSAFDTEFLETPALSARSVIVQTLCFLSDFSLSTSTSIRLYVPILSHLRENMGKILPYLSLTWDKDGIIPVQTQKESRFSATKPKPGLTDKGANQ